MTRIQKQILPVYVILCIALGGASAAGYLANLALQVLAILLLCWALASQNPSPLSSAERSLGWLLSALCGLMLLQFVPLPIEFWSLLGERGEIAAVAAQTGNTIAYPAISLMPHESLKSAVWLLPSFGIIVWMIRTRAYSPDTLAWVAISMACLSLILGSLQIGGGRNSQYYIYDITNRGSTVGFFANSNHLATLLLMSLPFIPASAKALIANHPTHRYPLLVGAMGLILVILAGIYVNGSLTGYSLVLPVLAASLLIFRRFDRLERFAPYLLGFLVIAGIGLAFMTDEGAAKIGASASLAPGDRRVMFANTIRGAIDYAPFGSGIGSFLEIYRQYQDPLAITRTYINHAHNDYLEVLLETGITGAVLILSFLAWWFWRVTKIWRERNGCPFARAAVIASGVVLLHSLVDYPLRTAAISSIFAICIVLMARPTAYEGPPSLVSH
jgi:O-antigen ligase